MYAVYIIMACSQTLSMYRSSCHDECSLLNCTAPSLLPQDIIVNDLLGIRKTLKKVTPLQRLSAVRLISKPTEMHLQDITSKKSLPAASCTKM